MSVPAEIPLQVVLSLLDAPESSALPYVLKSLYLSKYTITKASKAEVNHLISKINNLLNAKDNFKKWYGSHVVQVVALNPVVLTNGGSTLIVSLLKIINDSSVPLVNLKNAALALDQLIKGIRGKPVLTREILTPNLPNIISSLLDNLNKDIFVVLPILKSLLLKNTTTFRPFVKKFETKLVNLLLQNFSGFNNQLKKDICQSYAYLNLVKPTQNSNQGGQNVQALPDDQWRSKIFKLLGELRSAIVIYDDLVELRNDRDSADLLSQLPNSETNDFIFPFIKVDLSEPISITQISQRIEILAHLLIAFLTSPTPFPIRIPLGLVIQASELLLGISPNYIPFKKELERNQDLKKIITNDICKTQAHGALILYHITKHYKKLVLPHLSSILSSLEVVIPVKNDKKSKVIKIDDDSCLAIEAELLTVIKTTLEVLKLFQGLADLDLVNKLVDASLLFLQKRTPLDGLLDKQELNKPQKQQEQQGQKNKKRSKNKDSTPLADILSHAQLFELDPPRATVSVVLSFFETIIMRIPTLSPNYRIKIVKYVISSAVKQETTKGHVSDSLKKLLQAIVLYPSNGEVISILPIAKRLLSNNEVLSLLTNPRFPPLETKYKAQAQAEDVIEAAIEADDDDEIVASTINAEERPAEAIETMEEVIKTREVPIPENNSIVFKTDEQIKEQNVLSFADEKHLGADEDESSSKTRSLEAIDEDDTPSKRIKIVSEGDKTVQIPVQKIGTNDDEDSDSDFEIPNIEIDSDEEGEEDE